MGRPSKYSPELRERAVRLVQEHTTDHPSQWVASRSVAKKLGCSVEALRRWVRQSERDAGARAGLTTDERHRLRQLEREHVELRRTNEILKKASALMGWSASDKWRRIGTEEDHHDCTDTRHRHRQDMRLRTAKLRYPASLEDVDYATPRGLQREVILSLGTGGWIRDHHNLLLTGPTGNASLGWRRPSCKAPVVTASPRRMSARRGCCTNSR